MEASRKHLGRLSALRASCGILARLGSVLEASRRFFGASWDRLGSDLGRLGSVSGPCWAVLRHLGASRSVLDPS